MKAAVRAYWKTCKWIRRQWARISIITFLAYLMYVVGELTTPPDADEYPNESKKAEQE